MIADAKPDETCVKIAKQLKKVFKGHLDAWSYFFEVLGFSGVLSTPVEPGYLQEWTDVSDRNKRSARSETPSPCCHWRRSMGMDGDIFHMLFPKCRLPKSLRT